MHWFQLPTHTQNSSCSLRYFSSISCVVIDCACLWLSFLSITGIDRMEGMRTITPYSLGGPGFKRGLPTPLHVWVLITSHVRVSQAQSLGWGTKKGKKKNYRGEWMIYSSVLASTEVTGRPFDFQANWQCPGEGCPVSFLFYRGVQ